MGRKPDRKLWGCIMNPCPFGHTTALQRAHPDWADAHHRAAPVFKPKPAVVLPPPPPPEPFTPEHPDGLIRFARSVWPMLRPSTQVIVRAAGDAYLDAVIVRALKTKLVFITAGRQFDLRYGEVAAIYWHPAETGLAI